MPREKEGLPVFKLCGKIPIFTCKSKHVSGSARGEAQASGTQTVFAVTIVLFHENLFFIFSTIDKQKFFCYNMSVNAIIKA